MNISLTKELEEMVHEQVRGGQYQSASEVIREALRLFHERQLLRQIRLEELRKEIDKGLKDVEEGRVSTWDIDEFLKKARARRKRNTKCAE